MKENSTARSWAQVVVGVVLAAAAIAAVRVDVLNNLEYGLTVSEEMATIFVLAAGCVFALPAAAGYIGWHPLLRIGTALCIAATVWAAVNAYTAKQGKQILDAQATQTQYRDAQADAEAARADARAARDEAARITETASVDALKALQANAVKAVDDLTTKAMEDGVTCAAQRRCREAQASLATVTARLGAAETKAAALVRAEKADAKVKEAKAEAKGGPAEASMVSTWIADHTGTDANAVARTKGIIETGVAIVITQVLAMMGNLAVTLISGAVADLAATYRGRRPKGGQGPKGGKRVPAQTEAQASNVVSIEDEKKKRATPRTAPQKAAKNAVLKAQLAALLAKGLSVNEAARQIDYSKRSTFQRWAKQMGQPEAAKKSAAI